jgi:DtxR family Mn-dependent transcriptional regulator
MVKDKTPTGVSASQEDYLEAIYWLAREHKVARSRDISTRLQVAKSSVTTALKQLNSDGHINYDPYSFVTLTESGNAIARNVIRRHRVLKAFLYTILGLDVEQADRFACAIEHTIDDDILLKLEAFMEFANTEKPNLSEWIKDRAHIRLEVESS